MGSLFLYLEENDYSVSRVSNRVLSLRKRGDFLSSSDMMQEMWVRVIFYLLHSILKLLELVTNLDFTLGIWPTFWVFVHLASESSRVAQSMTSDSNRARSQLLISLKSQMGALDTFSQQNQAVISRVSGTSLGLATALMALMYCCSMLPSCVTCSQRSFNLSEWISRMKLQIFFLVWSRQQYCSLGRADSSMLVRIRMEKCLGVLLVCRMSSTWQSTRSEPSFLQMVMMSLGSCLKDRKPLDAFQWICRQQSGISFSLSAMPAWFFFMRLSLQASVMDRMFTICWNCRWCSRTSMALYCLRYVMGKLIYVKSLFDRLASDTALLFFISTSGHRKMLAPAFIICQQASVLLLWAATSRGVSPMQSPPSIWQQVTWLLSISAYFLIRAGLLKTSRCRGIRAGLRGYSSPHAQCRKWSTILRGSKLSNIWCCQMVFSTFLKLGRLQRVQGLPNRCLKKSSSYYSSLTYSTSFTFQLLCSLLYSCSRAWMTLPRSSLTSSLVLGRTRNSSDWINSQQVCTVRASPIIRWSSSSSRVFIIVVNSFSSSLHFSRSFLALGSSLTGFDSNLSDSSALVLPYFGGGRLSASVSTRPMGTVYFCVRSDFFYFFLNIIFNYNCYTLLPSLFCPLWAYKLCEMMNLRKVRSMSEEEIPVSPMFESFEDFVRRGNKMAMFESLQQTTQPDEETNDPLPPLPPQFLSQSTKEQQRKSSLLCRIIKFLILLLTCCLIVLVLWQQRNWNTVLAEYRRTAIRNKELYPQSLSNLMYIKNYHEMQASPTQNPKTKERKAKNMSEYLAVWKRRRQEPLLYRDIEIVKDIKELPFCLYVHEKNQDRRRLILDSVMGNQYGNFIVLAQQTEQGQGKKQQNQKKGKLREINTSAHSYQQLKESIFNNCPQDSVLLFVDSPILPETLRKFNSIHQSWNIYLTYSESQDGHVLQVHSFYSRVLELLGNNDFGGSNGEELATGDLQVMALGMLELCVARSKAIDVGFMYAKPSVLGYFLVNGNSQRKYNRQAYQGLTRLSQDFPMNLFRDRMNFKHIYTVAQREKSQYIEAANLSISKMLQALELQDFLYLPANHSVINRQLQQYNSAYKTGSYMSPQLPFCISILSHNNVANNRYIKVLLSILKQDYTNYHLVFFDDLSSDETLASTRQFLESKGFPRDRVRYVRNLERKYATYNILNAGFNFCADDDIQVLMDGDDELIGAHVLTMVNGLYLRDPDKWLIYTNFKSNLYEFGESKPVTDKSSILSTENTRVGGHHLGQLRTFRVKLLRMIPKQYHQTRTGSWLDTVYDDALQHSLFELASLARILYVPEICYEYNREYGDNDDSSEQKLIHRFNVYGYLLGLKPLDPLADLTGVNQEMEQLFKKQMSSKTFQVS